MQPSRNFALIHSQELTKTKYLNEIRSQKNLISQNFIQQTDDNNETQNQEGRRQTQMENIEMRMTYAKPKMFKKPRLPWHTKTRPIIKQNKEDSIKMMIENNQYKQAQDLLPPLPLEQKQKEKKQSFSPYNLITNFRNQFNNVLQREQTDILQQGRRSYKAVLSSKYLPQQFITLEIMKSAHTTGGIKKVLHLPNFKLYAAKQQPINSKQTMQSLKQWLLFWKFKINQQEDSPFIKIINIDWNTPEGYVTVTTQYTAQGSLENLFQSIGTLPENVIQQLCLPILKCLLKFYSISECAFGSLTSTQILFGPNLQIKLGLGLASKGSVANNTIYNSKLSLIKQNIFNVENEKGSWTKQNSKNIEIQKSLDILKFGLILLRAATGSFDMFSQSTKILENLKELITQQGQRIVQKQNLCCVIHSEKQIIDLNLNDRYDKQEGQGQAAFQFITFIKQRYSSVFLHFLCMCLQLSHSKRSSIVDLINYPFVKSKQNQNSVKVTLQDLHKITKPSIDLSASAYHKKLQLIIKSVQSHIRHQKLELLPDFKSITKNKIMQLSIDLGIPDKILEDKINQWKKYSNQY